MGAVLSQTNNSILGQEIAIIYTCIKWIDIAVSVHTGFNCLILLIHHVHHIPLKLHSVYLYLSKNNIRVRMHSFNFRLVSQFKSVVKHGNIHLQTSTLCIYICVCIYILILGPLNYRCSLNCHIMRHGQVLLNGNHLNTLYHRLQWRCTWWLGRKMHWMTWMKNSWTITDRTSI